jgi:hypothetical protein
MQNDNLPDPVGPLTICVNGCLNAVVITHAHHSMASRTAHHSIYIGAGPVCKIYNLDGTITHSL